MSAHDLAPTRTENSTAESWRYRCPKGHTSYKPHATDPGIYCATCGEPYDHVVDAKTGKEVTR